jgi:hypothetical protein
LPPSKKLISSFVSSDEMLLEVVGIFKAGLKLVLVIGA